MNCQNCGAAMVLHQARYFFCAHCGSFHFPESEDPRLRVLGAESAPVRCAGCQEALVLARIDDRVDARYCRRCRGVLLSRAVFAEVVETRRAWASTPPVVPTPLDRRALERSVACPTCSTTMATHPYYGPGNVVIDSCERCQGIWLDFGELQQIVDAPGRDRGRGPRPPHERNGDETDLLGLLTARLGRRDDQ